MSDEPAYSVPLPELHLPNFYFFYGMTQGFIEELYVSFYKLLYLTGRQKRDRRTMIEIQKNILMFFQYLIHIIRLMIQKIHLRPALHGVFFFRHQFLRQMVPENGLLKTTIRLSISRSRYR